MDDTLWKRAAVANANANPDRDNLEQRLTSLEALITALVVRGLARADCLTDSAKALLSLVQAAG